MSNLKGVVLESFGAGNVPDDIVQTLKAAIKRQVLIVNVTQCLEGSVDDSIYAAGKVGHGYVKVTFSLITYHNNCDCTIRVCLTLELYQVQI